MASAWSEEAHDRAAPIWARIWEHPFLREIREGSLPDARLLFYFEQNTKFIETAVRCRSIAAAKSSDRETLAFFTVRTGELMEELEHQRQMLRDLGGNPDAPIAPTCHAYTNHLQVVSWSRPPGWYIGTFLPCPWTYDILGTQFDGTLAHPLHSKWWSFYGSEAHKLLAQRYREFADEAASHFSPTDRELMIQDFVNNSRYELRFWDMAYNQETWEV